MCGVVGYFAPKHDAAHNEQLEAVIRHSKIRGLHAFGYAYFGKDGEIATHKFLTLEKALESVFEVPKLPAPLIYHNRYSTSGDYQDPLNNQPITVGDISLAYNGVLDMGTKEEMEQRWGVKLTTYNDGELFVQALKNGADPAEFVRLAKGSFAGVYLMGGRAFALRNPRRPLYRLRRGEATFIASTADIFKRALGETGELLEPNKVYALDDTN